jgi:uncharacterized membrane protein YkvA (DUF1232 family)
VASVRVWEVGLGVVGGLLVAWLVLVGALFAGRPRGAGGGVREAVRLLPDLLRLIGRLTADRSLPMGVRARLALLAAYLAMPFDLVHDFVPVLGYADDAIVVAWTLRSVTRRTGLDAVRRHWPGTDEGFAALQRLIETRAPRWWVDAALLAGFAALTLALANGVFLGLDLAVRDWSDAHRPPAANLVAQGLNHLGQGLPLTVLAFALGGWLAWRRHSVRPLLPPAAAFVLTYVTLGPLKLLFDRAAPHAFQLPHPERLFSGGLSYPSGHVGNAIVWYGVLATLLGGALPPVGRALLRVAPPAIVCLVTTYTGFHWLTDTVGGLLLGLVLDRVLRRVPWNDLPLGGRLAAAGWAGPGVDR